MKLEKAVICGDWHKDWGYIEKALKHWYELGIKEIIHVGDVGFMFNIDIYLKVLSNLLKKYDIKLYFIEGNHEDYSWLTKLDKDEEGLNKAGVRIKHIPRGYRIKYKEKDIVFVGGGVSVDQHRRRKDYDWWSEEELTDEEVKEISEQDSADILISHDCPITFELGLPNSHYFPSDLIEKSDKHREKLDKIYKGLGIKQVVCGHYHIVREEEGIKVLDCNREYVNDTQYILLDDLIEKL